MVFVIDADFEKMFGSKSAIIQAPGAGLSQEDQMLMEFLKQSAPRIVVAGTGGSGSNTINRMQEIGIMGASLVAMNTDAQHLLRVKAHKKLLLGKKKTKGLGAGSNPEVGEAAAEESEQEIKQVVEGADLVFVTAGMGGGTGTGSAHIIAKAAKECGAVVIAIVTMPFTSEGKKRAANAAGGLEKLRKHADTTIAIPNDKLLYFVPDLPLNAAFKVADSVLANAVKGIAELITKPGLVNLDFADMRTILERGGMAVIGLGEVSGTEGKDRVIQAAERALASPLLDVDYTNADRALINVSGAEDLTLGEAESAVSAVAAKIHKDAHIIWGATIDNSMEKRAVRVLCVLAGIKEGPQAQKEPEESLEGVEFI
ncbi:MAG: cell division protein FtsZ [Candidatus Micrarchaeota archaeon]